MVIFVRRNYRYFTESASTLDQMSPGLLIFFVKMIAIDHDLLDEGSKDGQHDVVGFLLSSLSLQVQVQQVPHLEVGYERACAGSK